MRNYLVKIFLIKVENTGGPIDDTKYHTDHFAMKDCIDMLMAQLYLKKKGSWWVGIQITGNDINMYIYFFSLKNYGYKHKIEVSYTVIRTFIFSQKLQH